MCSFEIDVIRQLINNRENKNIDFKRSLDFSHARSKNKLAIDVLSFADAEGGTIIIGVDDRTRDIIGIPSPLDHDQIVQSITDLTDPPVDISIDTIEIDGKLLGLIKIQRGKTVHRLRSDRTVYIRRDGINYKATPEEIAQLLDERDYSSRVYLSESNKLFSSDNGVMMLSGAEQPYMKITKRGGLEHLAECPVFLPEFSRWISAPEFGDTKGSLMVSYHNFDHIRHNDFIAQVTKVEDQLSLLGRYLDVGLQGVLNWSISSHGVICYGRGSETLLKALEKGELGVISITACGEFRNSNEQRTFLFLICGYCKSRKENITLVQDREMRLYLSALPVSNVWVHALFSPLLNEDIIPFSLLSYELVHPRLRVWRPIVHPKLIVPMKGILGRYEDQSSHYAQIGAAIADTKWFDPKLYKIEPEWQGGNVGRDQDLKERLFEKIKNARKIVKCPIELLNECVVSLTNPIPFYDDIESRNIKGFHLPLIKHLELEVIGHTVHVLGLNASPIEG